MTFQRRGITSNVSVTSSPSFDSLVDPQQGQALRRGDDDALARQVLRKRLPRGPLALEWSNRLGRCLPRRQFVLGRCRFEIFELQLHLLEKARLAFRAAAVELPAQLLDRELEVCDERFRARQIGLGVGRLGTSLRELSLRRDARRALGEDHRMSIGKVGGKRFGGSGHGARESYPPPLCKPEPSSDRGWTPGCLGMTPIDAGQKVSELRRRDRHGAVGRARPQESTSFQSLREQACALAVMPDHLQEVAAATAKAKQMAAQRIAPKHLLNLQRQARKPLPHVRVPGRQPHPHAVRNRDRQAVSSPRTTCRRTSTFTGPSTMIL